MSDSLPPGLEDLVPPPPPPPPRRDTPEYHNYGNEQGNDDVAGYAQYNSYGGGGYVSKAARAAIASAAEHDQHSYPHNQYAGPEYEEEPQYVRPDYKLHPALREESTPRPYKRKTVDPSSSADDDIRPNLAFQNYPFSSSSSSFPSSNFPSAPSKPAVVPYQRKLPTREETYEKIGPQAATPFSQRGGGEDTMNNNGGMGVAPYKRKTFTVEESREKARNAKKDTTSGAAVMNNVVASIREKLAAGRKISKGQAKILDRDQDIVDSITLPTYVSHRTGSGLTPEQVKKAQEEHTRKLLGWKYHQATKAHKEQALNAKRQKQ